MVRVEAWPLRLRVGLLFLLLFIACCAVSATALWIAAQMIGPWWNDAIGEALIAAALLTGFGLAGLIAAIWWLFDTHVARPLQRLSGLLRARAAGGQTGLDHNSLRYLGDLSSAAEAMSERLGSAHDQAAHKLVETTKALSMDREKLTAILSDLPIGVMVLDQDHHIIIYDEQSQTAFGEDTPLVLGRHAARYFTTSSLETAFATLAATDGQTAINAPLVLQRTKMTLDAKLRRLADGSGTLLTFEVASSGLPTRPVVFDFALTAKRASVVEGHVALSDLNFVVFDTETTGLNPSKDDVVQIGAVRMRGDKMVPGERFDSLVNPGRPIPPFSTRVHGIKDEDVVDAPSFAEAGARFCRFAGRAVIVAHNAPFDLAFFDREAAAIGERLNAPVLDTVLLSAALFGGDEAHSLDALAERFGVVIPEAHRHTALGDAIATAEVFGHMIRFAQGRGIVTLADAIDAMHEYAHLLPDVLARPANRTVTLEPAAYTA